MADRSGLDLRCSTLPTQQRTAVSSRRARHTDMREGAGRVPIRAALASPFGAVADLACASEGAKMNGRTISSEGAMNAVFDAGSVDATQTRTRTRTRTRTLPTASRYDGSPSRENDDTTGSDPALPERRPASILAMQRAAGNRAVAAALGSRTGDRVSDPSRPPQRRRSGDRDGDGSRQRPRSSAPLEVQRSLKFEFQTANTVWAVKNTGSPDPKRLPRKYAATSRGYGKSASQERGDRPAYLAVEKGRAGPQERPGRLRGGAGSAGHRGTSSQPGTATTGPNTEGVPIHQAGETGGIVG